MLLATVRRTIERHAMIPRGARVLVACSGGPDSTALLFALSRLARPLGFALVVATIDHGLRAGAVEERALVEQHALSLGLVCRAERVDVGAARAAAPRTGRSIHAVARALRYEALHGIATREGCARIAVGHTSDDQAETVLARVLRGSGLPGLRGIRPVRDDGVVRPLLDVSRRDVTAYLDHLGIRSMEDPSNDDPRFLRARVRATLLPALAAEDPDVVAHLGHLAEEASAAQELLSALADETAGASLVARPAGGWELGVAPLRAAHPAARALAIAGALARVLGRPARRSWVEQVRDLVEREPTSLGEVLLSAGWRASRRRGSPVVVLLRLEHPRP